MVRDDTYLWERVILPCYREMYLKSEPSADFDHMMSSGETKVNNFWRYYYMPIEEQNGIIDKHCKIHNLNDEESVRVHFNVTLGCSPSSINNSWDTKDNG